MNEKLNQQFSAHKNHTEKHFNRKLFVRKIYSPTRLTRFPWDRKKISGYQCFELRIPIRRTVTNSIATNGDEPTGNRLSTMAAASVYASKRMISMDLLCYFAKESNNTVLKRLLKVKDK